MQDGPRHRRQRRRPARGAARRADDPRERPRRFGEQLRDDLDPVAEGEKPR